MCLYLNSLCDISLVWLELIARQQYFRMNECQLRDPFLNPTAITQNTLKQYQQVYSELKNELIAQDKSTSNQQATKLKQLIAQLQEIQTRAQAMHAQCASKTTRLLQEIDLLEQKIQDTQVGAKNAEVETVLAFKIAEQQKTYLSLCQKRVQIAQSIEYKQLRKIEMVERKSLGNEVFKWVLVALYTEPENKYYWPNFKEQVIENKEGFADLRQRLGKLNAYNAKQQQRVKTIKLIDNFQKIRVSPEFKHAGQQIQKIYLIAKIFLECSDIGRKVLKYEKQIQDIRNLDFREQEALMRSKWEQDALTQKLSFSQLYLNRLTAISDSFRIKKQAYQKEADLLESYLLQLETAIAPKNGNPEPTNNIQKTDNWQCNFC